MAAPLHRIITCLIESGDDGYIVRLLNEEQRAEIPPYRLEWEPDARLIETLTWLGQDHPPIDMSDRLHELGHALYQALFGGAGYAALRALDQGHANKQPIRLQLYVQPPELARLPWEAMHDGITLLSARSELTLVRLVEPTRQIERIEKKSALRILFVTASPEGMVGLQVQEAADDLDKALNEHIRKRRILFEKRTDATKLHVQKELQRNDYHVICFACHGNADALFLDDGVGDPDALTARELALMLEGKSVQLVMLMACRTGAFLDDDSQPIVGFAKQLIESAKVPAVVAMQTPISEQQANPFVEHFFISLSNNQPVDVAVAEARKVLAQPGRFGRDVIAPVLWLQAQDSRLFRHSINRLTMIMAVCIALVLIAAGLLLQKVTSENYARVLAYQAERELNGFFPERSIPLALLAKREQSEIAAEEQILYQSVFASHAREMIPGVMATYSPDGQHILDLNIDPTARDSALQDQPMISIRNASTGEIEHSLILEHTPDSPIFRPDGQQVAVIEGDAVVVWDFPANRIALKVSIDTPIGIAFSPDNTALLASTSSHATLWRIADGQQIWSQQIGKEIRAIAFHPSEQQFASITHSGLVSVWNANDGTLVRSWQAYTASYENWGTILSYSPDGTMLLTSGNLGQSELVQLWDISTGKVARTLGGTYGSLAAAVFSGDGSRLAISFNQKVAVWDTQTWQVVTELKGHRYVRLGVSPADITHISFNNDGTKVLTSGFDGYMRRWDVVPVRVPITLPTEAATTFVLSADGTKIASYSGRLSIHIWQTATGELIRTIPTPYDVKALAFSPDGNRLAAMMTYVMDGEASLRVWELATGTEVMQAIPSGDSITFSPDGQVIFISSYFNTQLIDATTGQYLNATEVVSSDKPQLTPDGNAFVSLNTDRTGLDVAVKATVGQPYTIETDHRSINAFALSGDGRFIATLGDGRIAIWDHASRRKYQQIPVSGTTGACVALSHDGQRVMTNVDGQAVIWNVENGAELVRLGRLHTSLGCGRFTPDGLSLITVSSEQSIIIWPLWAEPLSLEQYARTCCLIRPLDNDDVRQLTAIQPSGLRSFAGNINPLLFIPAFIGLYLACLVLLRMALYWGRPIPQREAQHSAWQRLRRIVGRQLFFLLSASLLFGWIVALYMIADPLEDYGALPLLSAFIPVAVCIGVAYYLLLRQRLRRLAQLRILLGSMVWGFISAGIGSLLGVLLSSSVWADSQPLMRGLVGNLWWQATQSTFAEQHFFVFVLAVLAFSLMWTIALGGISSIGCLGAMFTQALRRWWQHTRHRKLAMTTVNTD